MNFYFQLKNKALM